MWDKKQIIFHKKLHKDFFTRILFGFKNKIFFFDILQSIVHIAQIIGVYLVKTTEHLHKVSFISVVNIAQIQNLFIVQKYLTF